MSAETRVEGQRGCGFRKPGGLYLVCKGIGMPCGKLPIPLCTCPTCGQGIKPSRGWTWIDGGALSRSKPCDLSTSAPEQCAFCPLGQQLGRVGLLWIGEQFYPRPIDWMNEANKMGVSRRISRVPKDFKLGETWVFVAHRKGISAGCEACNGCGRIIVGPHDTDREPCRACDGEGVRYTPAVFHAFKPSAVEYVVHGTETEDELTDLRKRGITPVRVVRDGVLDFDAVTN